MCTQRWTRYPSQRRRKWWEKAFSSRRFNVMTETRKGKKLSRRGEKLTEVVRTPHSSNFSKVGVGALGVSINSNSDSLPFTLCGFDMLGSWAS